MDFVKNLTGGNKEGEQQGQQTQQTTSGGGFTDKLNNLAGGGAQGEKNEDAVDKGLFPKYLIWFGDGVAGVDWAQEHVLGQGPQSNESAIEQAKDEQISDFIRGQYKSTTGKDVPIADK
ncbi:hypothetical protein VP1G_08708 [Cytospora mali]|uniref:Uncharacterized protein n=1 Tax=Cytospora mali TaxID=578113 RepID=A0A194VCB1_CYTMA|nr:hypothetical protein VP1G_08708 [Valsa mali var. pyri (nom. inval.)]